jgi:hypothetical protein
VLSIALGAASSGQIKEAPWRSIHVNPERRLSDYVTYRWNPAQRPVDKSNHQVITAAIEAHLKKRGYVLDEVDPDIYVSYSLDLQEEELSRPGEYRDRRHEPGPDEPWDYLIWSLIESFQEDVDPRSVKIQRLAVSVNFDEAETGVFVWEAEAAYPWVPKLTKKSIDYAIADLLTQLPTSMRSEMDVLSMRDAGAR